MARVLAYTSPARGHLYPLTPIMDELRRRGHDISVRTLSGEVPLMRSRGFDASSAVDVNEGNVGLLLLDRQPHIGCVVLGPPSESAHSQLQAMPWVSATPVLQFNLLHLRADRGEPKPSPNSGAAHGRASVPTRLRCAHPVSRRSEQD